MSKPGPGSDKNLERWVDFGKNGGFETRLGGGPIKPLETWSKIFSPLRVIHWIRS